MRRWVLRLAALSAVVVLLTTIAGVAENPLEEAASVASVAENPLEEASLLEEDVVVVSEVEPTPGEMDELDLTGDDADAGETQDAVQAPILPEDGAETWQDEPEETDAPDVGDDVNADAGEESAAPAVPEDAAEDAPAPEGEAEAPTESGEEDAPRDTADAVEAEERAHRDDELPGAADEQTGDASIAEAAATLDESIVPAEAVAQEQPAEAVGAVPAALTLGVEERYALGGGDGFVSSKPKVASVSDAGLVTAKKKGTAIITVTLGGVPVATCQVTVKAAPRKVSLPQNQKIAPGQSIILTAGISGGYSSAIAWSSSDPGVAVVDQNGFVTGVGAGKARITAMTHNGKKAVCVVTVEPSKASAQGPATAEAGEAVIQLANGLGMRVDELVEKSGRRLEELNAMTAEQLAEIGAALSNGTPDEPDAATPPGVSNEQMVASLRNGSLGGSKRNALANVAAMLLKVGYEPTFVAGVVANVYAEGTYGLFESSKYVNNYQKRPQYFCYLDGGIYYTLRNGRYVPTIEYVPPELYATGYVSPNAPRTMPSFGPIDYYRDNWSGKYVWNCDLNALEEFINLLTSGQFYNADPDDEAWQGKFGLGVTQWTSGATRKLMAKYRRYAGAGSATITKDQVIAAENRQILEDLRGEYKSVYGGWRRENENALYGSDAAYSAGSWVCLKYEIPVKKERNAVRRGNYARRFYEIMTGRT